MASSQSPASVPGTEVQAVAYRQALAMGKGRSAQRSAFLTPPTPFAAILQVNYGFKMMFFFLSVVVLMNLLIAQVRSRQPGLCAHDRVLRIGVHDTSQGVTLLRQLVCADVIYVRKNQRGRGSCMAVSPLQCMPYRIPLRPSTTAELPRVVR